MSIAEPRNLAQVWDMFETLLVERDPVTREQMRAVYYMGAREYSRLLLSGHSCRREAENFMAACTAFDGVFLRAQHQ